MDRTELSLIKVRNLIQRKKKILIMNQVNVERNQSLKNKIKKAKIKIMMMINIHIKINLKDIKRNITTEVTKRRPLSKPMKSKKRFKRNQLPNIKTKEVDVVVAKVIVEMEMGLMDTVKVLEHTGMAVNIVVDKNACITLILLDLNSIKAKKMTRVSTMRKFKQLKLEILK